MFEKNEIIQVNAPQDKKCLLWEYDLTKVKKLTIVPSTSTKALLYDVNTQKFVYARETLKLEKNHCYRLFGTLKELDGIFEDSEFRGNLSSEYRFAYQNPVSAETTSFTAPVLVIGKFGFGKALNTENFVRAHMDEVSCDKPLLADYSNEKSSFNARQYFHDNVKSLLLDFIESRVSALCGREGFSLADLGRVKKEANVYAESLSKKVYEQNKGRGWAEIYCSVDAIEPKGQVYEKLKANGNLAALHKSNTEVLLGQLAATRVARAIEDEMED